jgi:glutamyl-Q tRNA(Asp) synthetase
MIDDLTWLGIDFHKNIRKQSEHLNIYQHALETLRHKQVIYPCFCTRKEIQQTRPSKQHQTTTGHIHDPYPGTCRHMPYQQQQHMMKDKAFAWRMNIQQVSQLLSVPLFWQDVDNHAHPIDIASLGDFIVARKDIGISYHLAVVIDDALQAMTHVIRGEDLLSSTPIHRVLQALLGLPSPQYHHHRLLKDNDGHRLAKRNQSTTLRSLRKAGVTASTLRDFLLQENATWPFKHDASAKEIAQQLGSTT